MRPTFPHANDTLNPVQEFCIHGRWCSLYDMTARPVGLNFSLYWNNEMNPIQHAMTALEVFNLLAALLNPKEEV